MKKLLALALIPVVAYCATPSFNDFNTNHFDVEGNQVSVKTNAELDSIVVNNMISAGGVYLRTNPWALGPTGAVRLDLPRQYFIANEPCLVTGWLHSSNDVCSQIMLSITNAAATNIFVAFVQTTMTPEGTNVFMITNGYTAKIWVEHNPAGPEVSAVVRLFR